MRRLLVAFAFLTIVCPLFATQPNPSPRQRVLVEKLLDAMDIDKNLHSMIDTMYGQIEKQYLQGVTDPDDIAEAKERFAAFRQHSAKINFTGELREAYVTIYSKYFSESELTDLLAFYATPTGRKLTTSLPEIMSDGMQAGTERLGPKIAQAMDEATTELEKKRPWRRTMADIRTVAVAIEAYMTDHDESCPAGNYESLESVLAPTYIKHVPEKDMWGHPYAYVVSEDHKHYRIVSAGADNSFEWDSLRIVPVAKDAEPDMKYRDRLEDDLIYADGTFLQLPVQTKPKSRQ
jgi:hypothetical protein